MKKIISILLLSMTVSCLSQEEQKNVVNNLSYYKDYRTNICFAGKHFNMNNAMLAQVPCTPEVEKLIVKLP